MANKHWQHIVEGLEILKKYTVTLEAYNGELWCKYNSRMIFAIKDIEDLKKLGWHHNNLPLAWWIEV